ncbi:hypothetical protein CEXT_620001 [Caerostris extrusa]|uniref:Uncharacterized protein n=1 Tax=Caerostris extrusa TaxID=172846 RepID=A0AAV4XIA5_CAEEX|nr:hypothetical protein CEXT_620001 [Caerostris extrusa]
MNELNGNFSVMRENFTVVRLKLNYRKEEYFLRGSFSGEDSENPSVSQPFHLICRQQRRQRRAERGSDTLFRNINKVGGTFSATAPLMAFDLRPHSKFYGGYSSTRTRGLIIPGR